MPARLANMSSKTYEIKKWLGVNENPDGNTRLKLGEADAMQNMRITDGNSLRVRQGSANIAGLLSAYTTTVAASATADTVETVATTKTYSAYAGVQVTDAGVFAMLGTPVTINYANHNTYTDYYYKDSLGNVKKFVDCAYSAGTGATEFRYSKYNCIVNSQYRWNKYSCDTTTGYRWHKYSCVTGGGETYYTAGTFSLSDVYSASSISGYTSYGFSSAFGYVMLGSIVTITGAGTVYTGGGSGVAMRTKDSGTTVGLYTAMAGTETTPVTYSKGTIDYGYVYDASDTTYPDGGSQLDGATRYWYEDETNISGYVKGETDYGYVYSVNSGTYPDGSSAVVSGTRYWFESRTYVTAYSKGATFVAYVYGDTDDYPNGAQQIDGATYYWYDGKVANTSYTWNFKAVTATTNSADTVVRGLWSGYVGGSEYICAACNGYLWSIMHNAVPNLLVNSDFANGTTGWSFPATPTISGGVATWTKTGEFAGVECNPKLTYTPTHIMYFRGYVQNDQSASAGVRYWTSGGDFITQSFVTEARAAMRFVSVRTSNATAERIDANIQNYTSDATTISAKELAIADLTAMFGAGNEPTQAWCDVNLLYNGNSLTIKDTTIDIWSKKSLGACDTSGRVSMFGFDEKLYVQDGVGYYYWDGTTYGSVAGYRPLVTVAVPPGGGGTALEQVNLLNGTRRAWYSPASSATAYQLNEYPVASVDYIKVIATGALYTLVTAAPASASEVQYNISTGALTFHTAPANGTNTLEIGYTLAATGRTTVTAMRYNELFSGATDAHVFFYGDGTNQTIYSGIDYDGQPNAEYFPALNEMDIGDANTPVTGLLRHYDTLLAFKEDSAYGIKYDFITLETGISTQAFYLSPINKGLGNLAHGQIALVENYARTLDGGAIYEWRTAAGGTVTNDQRNAQIISQRVSRTLSGFTLSEATAFFDKINHEYYCIYDGTAVVQNTENDTWYVYSEFPATCMIVYQDEVYYGTDDGYIRHFSHDYRHDNGTAINAYWHSGSMDFGAPTKRKASALLWVSLKPETSSSLTVEVDTDNSTTLTAKTASAAATGSIPTVDRLKMKCKKFVYYVLKLLSNSATTTATVDSVSVRVSYISDAK